MNNFITEKSKKTQAVEEYLKERLVPVTSRGFRYMVMMITQNMDNPNSAGLTIIGMCEELSNQLNVPTNNLKYHLRQAIIATNKNRKDKGMEEYKLSSFILEALIHFSDIEIE